MRRHFRRGEIDARVRTTGHLKRSKSRRSPRHLDHRPEVDQTRPHGLAIATLVMLGIMVATVVGWWVLLPEIAPKRITIAVLPFEQTLARQASPYLGEGIAADVAIALAQVPDFIVLDRAASFAYRSGGDVATRLAGELGATHVVEGRVRHADGEVALSARLTDLSEFKALWEEELTGPDAEFFAMRDALAVGVAKKLMLLGDAAISGGPPVQLRAYETFLEARVAADAGDASRAATLAERSLSLDDGHAQAHYLLATLYHREGRPEAAAHAGRAVALHPEYAPAQAFHAHLRFLAAGDLAAYHRRLTDLVATRRDAEALRRLACLYEAAGRPEDASTARSYLRQFDPLGVRAGGCPGLPALHAASITAVPWRTAEEVLSAPTAGASAG